MRPASRLVSSLFFFLSYSNILHHLQAQPSTQGFTCPANQSSFPCQTYAFYRASAPNFLDLASIGDLFSVSRLMISKPSNISSPTSPLIPNQPLFVPLSCSCNPINSTNISSANITYTIEAGNTFYIVSSEYFQNLTTYQSVELFNPTLIPELLDIGVEVIFPIFCKCPNQTQLQNKVNYLVSYVFQPSDNLSSVASTFGVETQSIVDVNGNNIQPYDTIFVPVNQLPQLAQPTVAVPVPSGAPPPEKTERKGVIIGLAVGLGIAGLLLVLVSGVWFYREGLLKKRRDVEKVEEKRRMQLNGGRKGLKDIEVNLMADVSDCLDKYRVFKIDELKEATNGFGENCLIEGSVFKGSINGETYAIKKMKWNACEELKILQKVNHGNLVKLEGFCIDPEDANCYLVYEFVDNGSLHSWLHRNEREKLSWKTRLRVAIDVANGLQYIHEHTRPRVVHKDIKSSNILLDSSMRAKIANFGLAKTGCNAITMHIVGTQGYIAPEYLADGVVSTRMDVFSFGVVLLELISGREAIDEGGKVLWAEAIGILDGNVEERKVKRLTAWMDKVLLEESCSMEFFLVSSRPETFPLTSCSQTPWSYAKIKTAPSGSFFFGVCSPSRPYLSFSAEATKGLPPWCLICSLSPQSISFFFLTNQPHSLPAWGIQFFFLFFPLSPNFPPRIIFSSTHRSSLPFFRLSPARRSHLCLLTLTLNLPQTATKAKQSQPQTPPLRFFSFFLRHPKTPPPPDLHSHHRLPSNHNHKSPPLLQRKSNTQTSPFLSSR